MIKRKRAVIERTVAETRCSLESVEFFERSRWDKEGYTVSISHPEHGEHTRELVTQRTGGERVRDEIVAANLRSSCTLLADYPEAL